MNKGKFIVIEGLEGAGKSTAIKTCEAYLNQKAIPFIQTREPGGTEVGEAIRHIFKTHYVNEPIHSKTELLLLYAARLQHIEYKIKPALSQGVWVICDRFELSTWAYQVGGRGIDPEMATFLSKHCVGDFKPDLTLFLDISPEVGLLRVAQRGALDRVEQEALSFFKRVYDGYQKEIQHIEPLVRIDAALPLVEVQSEIMDALAILVNQQ